MPDHIATGAPAAPIMTMIRTSIGPVPTWTSAPVGGAAQSERPLLVAIRGAFPPKDQLNELALELTEMDVVIAHLPGLITRAAEISVKAFAQALSEAISSTYAGRDVIVCGVSIGGLAALCLKNENIRGVVAVDPPLETGKLWPISNMLSGAWSRLAPHEQAWATQIFGIEDQTTRNVSYGWVVEQIDRPVHVLLGTVPLDPPREMAISPCLLDANDIRSLQQHPLVEVQFADGAGHDVVKQRPDLIYSLLRRLA